MRAGRRLGATRAARVMVAPRRTGRSDLALASLLAGIAGAANAGGFFALGDYTSHMTGYLARAADHLALGGLAVVLASLAAIGCFVAGAAASAALIERTRGRRQYAWPLVVQGVLLAVFGIGGALVGAPGRPAGLALLCFIMGMQNATITRISGARIRTTHATGMITDIGIELGRGALRRGSDRRALAILLRLVGAFLLGGVLGALGYRLAGMLFSLPLAGLLLWLGLPSLAARRG